MTDPQHETSAAPSRQVARGAPHAARALAPQTARLYASGWVAFVAWCRAARVAPLPAEPRTVVAYLATLGHLSPGAAAGGWRRSATSTAAPASRSQPRCQVCALPYARRVGPRRRVENPCPRRRCCCG